MLTSILWAMIDRYPGEDFLPTGRMLMTPMLNLLVAMVASGVVIVLLARYLPRTSIYRRFALMTSNPSGPSLATGQREFTGAAHLSPGMEGTALSILRPSGKARFGGQTVDVVTEGDFIPPNTPITVVQADGMRVVVRRA